MFQGRDDDVLTQIWIIFFQRLAGLNGLMSTSETGIISYAE